MTSAAASLTFAPLLLESPDGEWFTAVADGTIDDPLTLERWQTPLADIKYPPDVGYFLSPGMTLPAKGEQIPHNTAGFLPRDAPGAIFRPERYFHPLGPF